jgi:hypothetical protein
MSVIGQHVAPHVEEPASGARAFHARGGSLIQLLLAAFQERGLKYQGEKFVTPDDDWGCSIDFGVTRRCQTARP